jgi:hypothetical protein
MNVAEPEIGVTNRTLVIRKSTADERLKEFIAIWERKFAETLTPQEAAPIASRLVNFYRELIRGTNAN